MFTAFTGIISAMELLPPFFIQDEGGTMIRDMLVATTSFILLVSGFIFLRRYYVNKSLFLYWYSLGLLLLALGMGILLLQTTTGSALNWTGRSAQLLGGVFLLMAALVSIHEASTRKVTTGEVMADQFTDVQARLKESEERFRTLSETSPVGVGVSSAAGVLVYANKAYSDILGYSQEELKGLKAADLYMSPADRQAWVAKMLAMGVIRDFELRLKRKDGSPVWVSVNVSPIEYGGEQAVMGTIQDITERKKADESLLKSQQTFADLIEGAPFGIYVVDSEFRIAFMNKGSKMELSATFDQ